MRQIGYLLTALVISESAFAQTLPSPQIATQPSGDNSDYAASTRYVDRADAPKVNKTGDTLAGLYRMQPGGSATNVQDLWSTQAAYETSFGTWLSGGAVNSAPFSYLAESAKSIGTEQQRTQNLIKFRRSTQTSVAENALAIDAIYDQGGPDVQGTSLALSTTLSGNVGKNWLSAADMHIERGWTGSMAVNHEFDILNLGRDAFTPGNGANIYNLFLYGFAKYPGTEIVNASVPSQAPAVGAPSAWQANHAYAIDGFSGAPVVSSGGNYYFLISSSCTSGGTAPTGTDTQTLGNPNQVSDGGCTWESYNAVFTGGDTGGAWHNGIAFRGGNLIQNDAIVDSTNAQRFIASDSRSKHSVAWAQDLSTTPASLRLEGSYSLGAILTRGSQNSLCFDSTTSATPDGCWGKFGSFTTYKVGGYNAFEILTSGGSDARNGIQVNASSVGFSPMIRPSSSAEANSGLNVQANGSGSIGLLSPTSFVGAADFASTASFRSLASFSGATNFSGSATFTGTTTLSGTTIIPTVSPGSNWSCTHGQIVADDSAIYYCTSSGTYRRAALFPF